MQAAIPEASERQRWRELSHRLGRRPPGGLNMLDAQRFQFNLRFKIKSRSRSRRESQLGKHCQPSTAGRPRRFSSASGPVAVTKWLVKPKLKFE